MKLTKFDIGADVISILTKGMYPDPRDAIREYIQNAVDAGSKKVTVKIRQNSIVVQDNGFGMDRDILRKALRVGVSDKNPKKDVGFMGIGIYSSFHLCDKINIYSRMKDKEPYLLSMDFKGMRDLLKIQKELRLKGEIDSDKLTDLQTLLEKYISLSEKNELTINDFPLEGTRVELTGLNSNFYSLLSDFKEIKTYLKEVVPLHFDKTNFKWGEVIEQKIIDECDRNDARFELIDLNLQVNGVVEDLYKPYIDENFHNNSPQEPYYKILKDGKTFIGVVWGCLNSDRKKISNRELRGFLLKKQGFAIGKRENLVSYFGQRTHFDRYIGEVVVINSNLLPNASRNDLEYSSLRELFYKCLGEGFTDFNTKSSDFQAYNKASEDIAEFAKEVKLIIGIYNPYSENSSEMIKNIVTLNKISNKIDSIIKRNTFGKENEKKTEAKSLRTTINELKQDIENTIDSLIKKKNKNTSTKTQTNKKTKIAKKLSEINTSGTDTKKYESFIDLLKDLDIELTNDIESIFDILDEQYIQGYSENKEHYQEILHELKSKISDLII